jgi:hypothetical protein
MKKLVTFLGIVLLVASSLSGQVSTGNIYGKVVDSSGAALPGVTVTLTGSLTAPIHFVTTEEGSFRFLSLAPARDYSLKTELVGFKTTYRGDILIVASGNVNLTLTLEQGTLKEQVTVTARSPVIDGKKTSIGVNLSQEILQQLPSARDPFNVMKLAVGTVASREDVGGSESGQAIIPTARGGFSGNLFVLDGLVINLGSSPSTIPTYFDFDTFEEMNVTIGGADVSVQTGGVQLNMVSRRGGNKISYGGRFYFTDSNFQADNMTQAFRNQGLAGLNRINVIRDYGFTVGGPFIKDKFWAYGSYGVQDIQNITIYNTDSKYLLETYLGKLNLQIIPQNRLELFVQGNRKLMWGTGITTYDPEGTDRLPLYHFGFPILRIQDEHMFGDNMFVSMKLGWYNGGYIQAEHRDNAGQLLAINDLKAQRGYGGGSIYWWSGPETRFSTTLNYFKDNLFGMNHEIKVGFEYKRAGEQSKIHYPGNMILDRNFVAPIADFNGDGLPDVPTDPKFYGLTLQRGDYSDRGVDSLAGYLSDTITFGRFNVILGLRYDQMTPYVKPSSILAIDRANNATQSTLTAETINLLDALLPAVQIPYVKGTAADGSQYYWKVWSPRVSVSYDITGDGKTLAKLAFSQFGNIMSTSEAARYMPGGTTGFLYFYWWDKNGDNKAAPSELYWYTIKNYQLYRIFDDNGNFTGNWTDAAGKFWGNYDPTNPTKLDTTSYTRIDANAGSPRIIELLFTLEREIASDFGIQLNLSYRKSDEARLTYKYFPDTNTLIDQSYYVSAGLPPASIPAVGDTGGAKGQEWYYQNAQATAYSPYTWIKTNPDYYTNYWGTDFVFNKRLSNKWMLTGSVTYQGVYPHWGKTGVLNPTNQWAIDGVNNATRWTFKFGGLYQLPYGVDLAANLVSREGWRIDRTVTITDYRLPNPKSNSATLYLDPAGSEMLPTIFNLSLRLEKTVKILESGRIHFMLDLFNALNFTTVEARSAKLYGSYYIYPNPDQNTWVPNINYYQLTRVLYPRVLRFGVRFDF